MQVDAEIVEVDRIDGTSIIVTFADGVSKEFSGEQLRALPGLVRTVSNDDADERPA